MMNLFPTISLWAAFLAVILPLAAFTTIILLTRKRPNLSASISIAAMTASFLCALLLIIGHWDMPQPLEYSIHWLEADYLSVTIGVLLDPTSLLMLLIVTGISFLVQIYSWGYMAGDAGFARYYAYMSLFAWAMTSLTLAPNLFQLYVFWELVGLASYLLIGFWFDKFSASEAGKKAFVMTRAGDVSFLIGLLIVFIHLGNLNIDQVNHPALMGSMPSGTLTLSAILIFGGIIGKSAQFPLMTWLPDAMEGPTPVSALLHSATMVAAGVYLFIRLFPFFSLSPTAMSLFLLVGTLSMLLSATMATVSRDIKQVWAFSTMSQLGFMIMGLAAGSAYSGIFHLTTHAGFKALLFLCAGVFIHHYQTNDMIEIGRRGGAKRKIPMICMVIGASALAGLPPFSGFFSKELILTQLAQLDNPIWLIAGLLGAFLTAYYTFRLIFIIFFPDSTIEAKKSEASHAHHGSEQPMFIPLLILAVITVLLGFADSVLQHFLGIHNESLHPSVWLMSIAIIVAVGGVGLAYWEFGRKGSKQEGFIERYPAVYTLFKERWYLDRLYRYGLDHLVYNGISRFCSANDQKVIDGAVDGLGKIASHSGGRLSDLHTLSVQYRLAVMFAVVAFLALYLLWG